MRDRVTASDICPCCTNGATEQHVLPEPHRSCPNCAHRWRSETPRPGYYSALVGRNALPPAWLQRKFEGRVDTLRPLLREGQRLLEIGCAEGQLGDRVKRLVPVQYVGIELSQDAEIAARVLDEVHRTVAANVRSAPFDGLLSFHVLEHVADVEAELASWHRLLRQDGWLALEVPHRAGHPDQVWDFNPEHVHQFSAASLTALLTRSAFDVLRADTGHFESPAYRDSLRIIARPVRTDDARRASMLARFRRHLPGPFLVRGTGGDFRSFLVPLLDRLAVAGLIGEGDPIHGRRFVRYDPARQAEMPILVCSLRFEEEIVRDLLIQGHRPEAVVRLRDILLEDDR